jgi:2-C-methyl-D-erythritol 4-phosphate cytidylyltransferase
MMVCKMSGKKVTAVILAAGRGKRMNMPVAKQFLKLNEKPVLYYSIKAFEDSDTDEIILVCGHGQVDYCREEIVKAYGFKKVGRIVEGGAERYDSVYKGLSAAERTDYVLIHDGARPFISVPLINEVIDTVYKSKACIVAAPVKDTIKIVDDNGWINNTPDRNLLWAAQTPQAFEYQSIKAAYEYLYKEDISVRKSITDDAMVYAMFINEPVKIVKGDYYNIKLTTPEDLIFAKGILEVKHLT